MFLAVEAMAGFGVGTLHRENRNSKGKGDLIPNPSPPILWRQLYRFPLKQAATAASLVLTGDTIAQLSQRWTEAKALNQQVLLNQIVIGPSAIAVVFAWNNLWQGKLSQLPDKYRRDAFPTLLYGFRFWIPVSLLNFWVIPLQARVAFMPVGSIFWNFCLSSTLSKLICRSGIWYIREENEDQKHLFKLKCICFKFKDE